MTYILDVTTETPASDLRALASGPPTDVIVNPNFMACRSRAVVDHLVNYPHNVELMATADNAESVAQLVEEPDLLKRLSRTNSEEALAALRVPYLAYAGVDIAPDTHLNMYQLKVLAAYQDVDRVKRVIDNVMPSVIDAEHMETIRVTTVNEADEYIIAELSIAVAYMFKKAVRETSDGNTLPSSWIMDVIEHRYHGTAGAVYRAYKHLNMSMLDTLMQLDQAYMVWNRSGLLNALLDLSNYERPTNVIPAIEMVLDAEE